MPSTPTTNLQPPLPDPHLGNGHDWIDALTDGWHVVPAWGRDGWDLGAWPLVIVAHHDRHQLHAVATYIEGDLEVQAFASRADRDTATDHIAAYYWRANNNGPADLPDSDADLADHHRGPYRRHEHTVPADRQAPAIPNNHQPANDPHRPDPAAGPDQPPPATLHRWLPTGDDDQCLNCGLTVPAAGADVLPSHCPGHHVHHPHVLTHGPFGTLECGYCTLTITEHTPHQQITWECPGDQPTT